MKASLNGAGPDGRQYKKFKAFTAKEHFGLDVFHELSPSPMIEMKLQPQQHDPVNGNRNEFHLPKLC